MSQLGLSGSYVGILVRNELATHWAVTEATSAPKQQKPQHPGRWFKHRPWGLAWGFRPSTPAGAEPVGASTRGEKRMGC